MADLPDDPEQEQIADLTQRFTDLCVWRYGQPVRFTKGEAELLATAHADPLLVGWWLEQGCSPSAAVKLAT